MAPLLRLVCVMIVRQFLQWVRNASAGERAEATSALARAYLHSDLSPDDLAAAEGAMIMLLDDPSPMVRRALSEVFASSQKAPPVVVHALAADQPDVALPVLARSPLLEADDLVDLIATAHSDAQVAIAGRALLPRPVAAAIAEVGLRGGLPGAAGKSRRHHSAVLGPSHHRALRPSGADPRKPARSRRPADADAAGAALEAVADARRFRQRARMAGPEHAEYAAREACEKATVALAAETPYEEVGALVQHLRETEQLTAGMILRALLSGNVVLVEEALAELSGLPIDRVISHVHDKTISGFHALYRKAGLPDAAYPAFREGIAAMRQGALLGGLAGERAGVAQLKRRMVERVLAACAKERGPDMAPLLALLRRFAVEAAREEARSFCQDLVADGSVIAAPMLEQAQIGAAQMAQLPDVRLVA